MNRAAVTVLTDCNFYDNRGLLGAAIYLAEGGGLIAINVNFQLDPNSRSMPDSLKEVLRTKEILDSGASTLDSTES